MDKQAIDVLERIRKALGNITPKQRKLAEYILDNYKKAAFLNSTELAKAAAVSGSTVVRFAEVLDYPGFPEFKDALHNLIQLEINSLDMFVENDLDNPTVYGSMFAQGADNLLKISRKISSDDFNTAVELLQKQRRILVIGHQTSACLAEYTSYSIGKIRPDVYRITNSQEDIFNKLEDIGAEDVALIFAFPRFPQQTVRLANFLYQKKVPIIYITTKGINPVTNFATVAISVHVKFDYFIDDIAPVIYLIRAMAFTIAKNNRKQTTRQLEKFENFVSEMEIFSRI